MIFGVMLSLASILQKHQFFSAQPSSQSNSHIHIWLLEKPQLWQDGLLSAKWCLSFFFFLQFLALFYMLFQNASFSISLWIITGKKLPVQSLWDLIPFANSHVSVRCFYSAISFGYSRENREKTRGVWFSPSESQAEREASFWVSPSVAEAKRTR